MKQADLKKLYKDFGHYFAKNMPMAEIKITRSASYIGCMATADDRKDYAIYIGKPAIELAFRTRTKNVTWESILLHEMCHVWEFHFSRDTVVSLGKIWGGHSARFMDKLRAVERLTGIPQFWDFDPNYSGK